MIYLILIIYFIFRIYPYLLSPVPLGYDVGLYLYLWKQFQNISILKFTDLPSWIVQVYPPLLPIVGKFLSYFVNPEYFLIPISFVIAGLLFLSIYLYTKNLWTVLLLSISAIQYKFWWWYYIKNILATSFIFFYLYFDQKKSKIKYIFPVLLPWLHQPTAIIFFIILILHKNIKTIILFLLSFAIYYLPNYQNTILPFLQVTVTTVGQESGTFYNLDEAVKLMWPYLLLAIYGIYLSYKNKRNFVVVVMAVISLLIPLFGLFLSRRFIPFFDLFVIILAGYGAKNIFVKRKLWAGLYIFLLLIFGINFVYKNSEALIFSDEYIEIKLLGESKKDSFVLVADNEYTPWIYGYSDRKAIAPGFGEYDIYWSNDEWNQFWLSNNRETEIQLLNKLPKPLYIYLGDRQRQIKFRPEGKCYQRYSWHVWEFVCQK